MDIDSSLYFGLSIVFRARHILTKVQFVVQAEYKMNQCTLDLTDYEHQVEDICAYGRDPGFDQLIGALGHIARQRPKYLIDTVMLWRKKNGDIAAKARLDYDANMVRSITITLLGGY